MRDFYRRRGVAPRASCAVRWTGATRRAPRRTEDRRPPHRNGPARGRPPNWGATMERLWKATGLWVLAALCLASAAAAQESAAPGRRYLLLLHEDGRYQNAAGSAVTGRIAEYAKWSRETPGIESGDKLSDEAWRLSGGNAA